MSFNTVDIFTGLPENAKVWIYQASNFIDSATAESIEKEIKNFTASWTAHQQKVTAEGALVNNLFVILAADESEVGVSGCSIDSSVRFIKTLEAKYNLNFFNRLMIAFVDENNIKIELAADLIEKIKSGAIKDDILVFNNTVQTVGDMNKNWLIPLAKSWMGASIKPAAAM